MKTMLKLLVASALCHLTLASETNPYKDPSDAAWGKVEAVCLSGTQQSPVDLADVPAANSKADATGQELTVAYAGKTGTLFGNNGHGYQVWPKQATCADAASHTADVCGKSDTWDAITSIQCGDRDATTAACDDVLTNGSTKECKLVVGVDCSAREATAAACDTEGAGAECTLTAAENLGTATYGGKTYNAIQYHFHFPSEHAVAGKLMDGEVHVVHQLDGTTDLSDLLVVGRFLSVKEGAADNDFLKSLGWASIGEDDTIDEKGDKAAISGETDVSDIIADTAGKMDGQYWRYEGSLTTPPCTESVHWFVLEKALDISKAQADAYTADMEADGIVGTNRPLQPIVCNADGVKQLYQNTLTVARLDVPTEAVVTGDCKAAVQASGASQVGFSVLLLAALALFN